MTRGIYFLANDHMLELAGAFLSSLRRFNPTIPLCLIPYNDGFERLATLAPLYRFHIFDDPSVLERCDRISLEFHDKRSGQYRKFACWEGSFDSFLYIDVDTIVLQSLDFCFSYLSILSFLLATSNIPGQRKWVWHESVDQCNELPDEAKAFAGNTGFIASRKSALSLQRAEHRIDGALAVKEHMQLLCAEQPFLNYIIVTSGARYSSLSTIRRTLNRNIPTEYWPGLSEPPSEDGRVLPGSGINPCLLHWAGIWRDGAHRRSQLWKYYHAAHLGLAMEALSPSLDDV